MRTNITEIWRIETINSTYEIKATPTVILCKKMGKGEEAQVVATPSTEFLDKLAIGASFDIPGVVQTSDVEDYAHYVLTDEPKVTAQVGLGQHIRAMVKAGAPSKDWDA